METRDMAVFSLSLIAMFTRSHVHYDPLLYKYKYWEKSTKMHSTRVSLQRVQSVTDMSSLSLNVHSSSTANSIA